MPQMLNERFQIVLPCAGSLIRSFSTSCAIISDMISAATTESLLMRPYDRQRRTKSNKLRAGRSILERALQMPHAAEAVRLRS